jgi:hypothetical protein
VTLNLNELTYKQTNIINLKMVFFIITNITIYTLNADTKNIEMLIILKNTLHDLENKYINKFMQRRNSFTKKLFKVT